MKKGGKLQSKPGCEKKATTSLHNRRLSGKAVHRDLAAAHAMAEPDAVAHVGEFTLNEAEPAEHDDIDLAPLEDELDTGDAQETYGFDAVPKDRGVLPESRDQEEYESGKSSSKEYLLQSYFRDIARIPLLSTDETIALFKQFDRARKKKNSHEAAKIKEDLVSANLRLVVSLAKTFSGSGIPLVDLIQAGNMGLMRSVDGFNHRLGFKFSTYASKWIFASITRMVSNQTRTVRIPVNVIPALKKIRQAEQQRLAENPEYDPPAAGEGKGNDKKLRQMGQMLQFSVSLDQSLDGGTGPTVLDTIRDDTSGSSITQNVDLHLLREQVAGIMINLDPREQKVLKLRYGLEDGIEHTQAEVAHEMNFSRQRVSQIERRALLRLRATGEIQKLKSYLN